MHIKSNRYAKIKASSVGMKFNRDRNKREHENSIVITRAERWRQVTEPTLRCDRLSMPNSLGAKFHFHFWQTISEIIIES